MIALFILKKDAVSCLDVSDREPDNTFTPHPARSALPTQFIFVST